MKLANKVAIITGAAGGIGQAAAILFAREGAKVALIDLRSEGLDSTTRQIRDEGGTAIALSADVSRSDDVQRLIAQTIAELGRPNVLFNNAGVNAEHRLPLFEI